jgi:hypothetical protein
VELGPARDPEVENLDVPGLADHHVCRLDVAMDDAGLVRRRDRRGHLDCVVDRLIERKSVAGDRQRPSGHVLHHDEVEIALFFDRVDGHHVRLVQCRGRARLVEQPPLRLTLPCRGRRQDLDRNRTVQDGIAGAVDLADAAFAEERLDHVVRDGRSDHGLLCLVFTRAARGLGVSIGTFSKLLQRYQHATVRYGRQISPIRRIRLASGRFRSLYSR